MVRLHGQVGLRLRRPDRGSGRPSVLGRRRQTHEIEVATADVRCKGRTNVVGVWFTVESAIQTRQIAANASAFEAALSGAGRPRTDSLSAGDTSSVSAPI